VFSLPEQYQCRGGIHCHRYSDQEQKARHDRGTSNQQHHKLERPGEAEEQRMLWVILSALCSNSSVARENARENSREMRELTGAARSLHRA